MRKLKIISLSLVVLVFFFLPLASQAVQDKAQENVYIGSNEVLNENVFKGGNSVVIEGQINGDLYVAGNVVTVKGPVAGSVFAVGNMVTINGDIGGSVFAVGSSVSVAGEVGGSIRTVGSNVFITAKTAKNLIAFGASVIVDQDASVGWDLSAGGASVSVNAPVGRNANFYGASVILDDQVSGNVYAEIEEDGSLTLLPDARVNGDLTYKAGRADQLTIQDENKISGQIRYDVLTREKKKIDKATVLFFGPAVLMWRLMSMVSLIIVGLVMVLIARKPMEKVIKEKSEKFWSNIGWGIVLFFLVPVIAIILMITFVGLPLALITLATYFIALYLVKVLAALVIGAWILELFNRKQEPDAVWSMIIGVIALMILISIPLIGWLVKLLAIWWGLGRLMNIKKEYLALINK